MPRSTARRRQASDPPRPSPAAAAAAEPSLRRSLAVLTAAIAVVYAGALATGLPLDAGALVSGNPALRAATWENVRTILRSDYWSPMATNGLYRPVTTLSFLLNWTLPGGGESPVGYHLLNLILHLAVCACVLALMRRLGLGAAAALLAALLVAVHPVTTEVVTNVAGRADLLAALFVLTGLLAHDRARRERGGARAAWSAALALSALLAAGSKENGAVLLPLVVAWDALVPPVATSPGGRLRGPLVAAPGIAVVLLAAWWIRRHGYPPEASPLDNPILDAGFWSGRATAAGVLASQLATLLWPLRLRADYSYDQIPLVGWPPAPADALRILAGVAVLLVPAAVAWRTRRREPALAFCCAWWIVTLLPTANLLVVIGSIRAERFLYLPLVGVAGVAAMLAARAGAVRPRVAKALAAVALVLCATRTMRRNLDWRDDLTLWQATVAVSPRNAKAHDGLAEAIAARDEPGTLPLAIAEANAALAIRPDYLQALIDLAGYEVAMGDTLASTDPAAARRHHVRALCLLHRAEPLDRRAAARFRRDMRAQGHDPRDVPDYGNRRLQRTLVAARARLGHLHGIRAAARRLQQLDPWDPQAYVDLAAASYRLGRREDAAVALHEALLLGADGDVAGRLAAVYRAMGDDAAVVSVPDGDAVRLVEAAPGFRRDRCRALRELAAIFADAALPDAAARFDAQARAACEAP